MKIGVTLFRVEKRKRRSITARVPIVASIRKKKIRIDSLLVIGRRTKRRKDISQDQGARKKRTKETEEMKKNE